MRDDERRPGWRMLCRIRAAGEEYDSRIARAFFVCPKSRSGLRTAAAHQCRTVVFPGATTARGKIRVGIRAESRTQQREAEKGKQQDGHRNAASIMLAQSRLNYEARRVSDQGTLLDRWNRRHATSLVI